jgi:hypothetical protein
MSQYSLTLPDDVLDAVRHAAGEEDTSVDQLLEAMIVSGLEQRRGTLMMAERMRHADPEAALALIKSLPSLPSEAWDEMRDLPTDDRATAEA